MYESARQYIFSVIFIISSPQIITPLWKIKKTKKLVMLYVIETLCH